MKKILLSLELLFICFNVFAQNTLAEWQEKLRTAKHDTTKMECYSQIADLQYRGDSMLYYVHKGFGISKKYPDHIVNVKLLNTMGRGFELKAKRELAVYYIKKANDLAIRLNDDKQIKYTHFNLILLNKSPAQQISELLKFLKKYNYNTSTPYDRVLLYTLYSVIANNYMSLENIDKGKVYLEKSQEFMTSYRDSVFYNIKYANLLSNKAGLCFQTKDTTGITSILAEYKLFFKRMLQFSKAKNDESTKQLMTVVYGHYAEILTYSGKYQEAIFFINKGPKDINQLYDNLSFSKYHALGENYVRLGQLKKGIAHLQKAHGYYKGSEFSSAESSILKLLAEAYSKLGQYKKAYGYIDKATKIDNDYYSKQQQQLSLEVDKQFELALKQEQIISKELENKFQEERIKSEKRQKYIFIGLLILSLSLLVWAIWSYVKQKQLRQLLEIQNLKLQKQTDILEVQAKELTEANQTKDKIFAVLGHDLHSPLNDLKMLLMLFHAQDITPKKMTTLMQSLTTKIESVQSMMNNLLQWSLLELQHENNHISNVSIDKLIKKVIVQLKGVAEKKNIIVESHLKSIEILSNVADLEIVLRNLLSNAIKFTPVGGYVYIEMLNNNDKVEIVIKDTGIGLPSQLLNSSLNYPKSTKGTSGETGVGLGLKICKELVKKNNGEFAIKSVADEGVEVHISFNNTQEH